MNKVVHGSVAVTPSETNHEVLVQRLLELRTEIDEILAALGRRQIAASAEDVESADERPEQNVASATAHAEPETASTDERLTAPPATGEAQSCEPAMSDTQTADGAVRSRDDLTLVSGIDEELAGRLKGIGIVAFSQIAGWSEQDVAQVSDALGLDRRICKENWIEQAAMLACGKMTVFAGQRSDQVGPPDADAGHDSARQIGEAHILVLEPAAPAHGQPSGDRDLAPTAEVASASKEAAPSAVVISLDAHRETAKVLPATRKSAPARRRVAFAAKLVACLIILVAVGVAMVDRDAWGGAILPIHMSPSNLQVDRPVGDSAPAKGLFEIEGFTLAN
jgi:predicted flap endonuclease-1-like 5' DNA nuclease